MRPRTLILPVLLVAGFLPAPSANACTIPVFRYALERWKPDAYEVIVFHRESLPPELQDLAAEARKAKANVQVRVVDLSEQPDEAMRKLWQAQTDASLPWLVVRYPKGLGADMPAWAGPASADAVRSLFDSPARREVARRLLAGETGVFLLLESGDAKADDALAELVATNLKKQEKELKLPDADSKQSDEAVTDLLSDLPVRIRFSTLRLARDDPAEKVLIAMLLQANEEVARSKEPVLFPIYGRGRALEAFIGTKEVNPETIKQVGTFLCGACSCTVKSAHPGVDLLFTADWDSILKERTATVEPAVKPKSTAPTPATTKKAPEAPANPGSVREEIDDSDQHPMLLAFGTASLLILITGMVLFWSWKQRLS